ncbi:hypothetical protein L195_g001765 [Trifolium pratense]|uniref:Uncharacterized protein n=1 Tax=Trifolium pratense TaxID=57577 RepID=A0A2K3NQL3_TRIPR|nr:hypothetical protein L195_g001765 [Trifolium pratense]
MGWCSWKQLYWWVGSSSMEFLTMVVKLSASGICKFCCRNMKYHELLGKNFFANEVIVEFYVFGSRVQDGIMSQDYINNGYTLILT